MVEPESPTADAPPDVTAASGPDEPPGAFDDTADRLRTLADDLHNQITAARVDNISSDKWLARLASIETRLSMVESSVRAEAERLRASIATIDDLAASVAHHLDRAVGSVTAVSEGMTERLDRLEDAIDHVGAHQADLAGTLAAAVTASLQAGAQRIDESLAQLASAPDPVVLIDELRSTVLGEVAAVRADIEAQIGRVGAQVEGLVDDVGERIDAAGRAQATDLGGRLDAAGRELANDFGARLSATGLELANGVGALRRDLEPLDAMSAILEKLLADSQAVDPEPAVDLAQFEVAIREQMSEQADVLRALQAAADGATASVQAVGASTTAEVARLADRIATLSGDLEVVRQATHRPDLDLEVDTSVFDRELELVGAQLDALGRLMQLVVRSVHLVEEATVGVTSDDREDEWAAAASAIARLRSLRTPGSA